VLHPPTYDELFGLVLWAIGNNDNPLRLNIAKLELERKVAAAQIETAKSTKSNAQWMLCSVIVLALAGFFTAVVQYQAWMYPHIAK
jgi:hypothetical protein